MISRRRMLTASAASVASAVFLGSAGLVRAADPRLLMTAPGLAGLDLNDVSTMAALYDKALTSGRTTINFYSSSSPVDPNVQLGAVFRVFESTFQGVKVQGLRISAAPLAARLAGEWASGHLQADIVSHPELLDQGRVQAFDPPLARHVNAAFRGPNNDYVAASYNPYGLSYNTEQVRPEEVPRSLKELLTSNKWRGRVTVPQPTGSESIDNILFQLLKQGYIDTAAVAAIADFVPRRQRSYNNSAVANLVSQGRCSLGLWSASSIAHDLELRGAPIAVAPFLETTVTPESHGILKDGPAPDASKLLINWLFSPVAQAMFASKVYQQGTIPGAAPPAGIPKLADHPVLNIPTTQLPAQVRQFYQNTILPAFGPLA